MFCIEGRNWGVTEREEKNLRRKRSSGLFGILHPITAVFFFPCRETLLPQIYCGSNIGTTLLMHPMFFKIIGRF